MQLGKVQYGAIGKNAMFTSGYAATGFLLWYGDTILGPRIDHILWIAMCLQWHLQ